MIWYSSTARIRFLCTVVSEVQTGNRMYALYEGPTVCSGESMMSVRHMTTQKGRERLYILMWNTLFIPSFFHNGARGTHVGLGESVRFNEAFSLRQRAAWSHGQAWWSVSWCAYRAHRGRLFSPALPDGILYIHREHSCEVYTEPTLAAFFHPLHSNAKYISPTWVSRSMPKIGTVFSIYILIAKTFGAFKARSIPEVHSSACQVLLAWADRWMMDVILGFHMGSSKGQTGQGNSVGLLALNPGLTPIRLSNMCLVFPNNSLQEILW